MRKDPQWDELVENFRQLDSNTPREPSAAERAAQLEKLFNTGPGAMRGPRDYVAEDTPEEFVPQEPAALGSGDPMLNLAWVGAAGGPLGLLLCVLFFRSAPGIHLLWPSHRRVAWHRVLAQTSSHRANIREMMELKSRKRL